MTDEHHDTAGRSESNYRLFDDSALWCARVIDRMRSLGLTIKEIEALASAYLSRPDEPIGPHLAGLLDRVEQRIADRIAELGAVRERIRVYRARHAGPTRNKEDRLMSTDYVQQTTALIGRLEGRQLLPHAIRLLSGGEPVALEELASSAGSSVDDVAAALASQVSAERDDHGRLIGLALTLRPTAHRIIVGGRTLYAWCASDTLMLPVILGRPARVESTCPQTGQPIRIELTPDAAQEVDPPEAVVSAVRPPGYLADVRSSTCDHGHFFSSIAATAGWSDAHPEGHIHPVDEAFQLDRKVIEQLGWSAA